MMENQEGGKVVASGGFGCIFKPSLKCENVNYKNNNKISKLMINRYAEDEFNQIQKYKDILKVIPNYGNYFLLDNFELCKPDKLTKEDLTHYQKKCKALKKKGINVKNINQSLDKIKTINMPDGGTDVDHYLKGLVTHERLSLGHERLSLGFININNSLINLLVNGIVPMNHQHVYHCDIKDANVLVKKHDNVLTSRLIDWGLSFFWDKSIQGIPRKLYRRPFQFNVPFSSIFFNKDFQKLYTEFLKLNPTPDYFQIREFVVNYIFIWNDIRGPGHLSAINDIVKKFTFNDLTAIKKNKIKEHFIEYDFTYYYIVEYLSNILKKYTINGTLNLMTYFENIFLKNMDIWGFTMIYISLYEHLYDSFNKLNHYQMEFITKIKYIIIHFLYENPINPIDIASLVNELTNLNKIIEKFDIKQPSKKLEYVSILKNNVDQFMQIKNLKNKSKNKTIKKKTKNKNKTRKR